MPSDVYSVLLWVLFKVFLIYAVLWLLCRFGRYLVRFLFFPKFPKGSKK